MNRKQRIIVSVTGIFIVLLALVGITYAYFLTRITGNTNEKSISVTTKNMVLEYDEETSVVQGITNAEPGYSVTKTFSAINKGDATSYVVVLENVLNEFERQEDLVYKLECTSINTTTKETSGTCNGVTIKQFPGTTDISILVHNDIGKGLTHNYTLTVTYVEAGVDQSIDMKKTFSARVNIADNQTINPFDEKLLSYHILNNAQMSLNGTTYRTTPLSTPAEETTTLQIKTIGSTNTVTLTDSYYYTYASEVEFNELAGYSLVEPKVDTWANIKANDLENFKYLRRESGVSTLPSERTQTIKDMVRVDNITNNTMTYTMLELSSTDKSIESSLSVAQDDYGPSYYYRGNVSDNYVNFNNMCWRIVRIEGDKSVKLVLESYDDICNGPNYKASSYFLSGNYGYAYNKTTGVLLPDFTGEIIDNNVNYASDGHSHLTERFDTFLINHFSDEMKNYLKVDDWCLGNITDAYNTSAPYNKLSNTARELLENDKNANFIYESYRRLYRQYPEYATLSCSSENYKKYSSIIGTLTVDEVNFAGLKNGYEVPLTYLNGITKGSYILMSLASSNKPFVVGTEHFLTPTSHTDIYGIKPSVVLNNDIEWVSGDGTVDNPYTVKKAS